MSYQSFTFLFFSVAVVFFYYALPKKCQKYVLLTANVFFYVYSGIKYVPFLAATLLSSFYTGKAIGGIYEKEKLLLAECSVPAEKKQVRAECKQKAKKRLTFSFIIIIGLLAVCKYTGFLLSNITGILGLQFPENFSMIVPLGISFYTFMAVSYVLDIYWKRYQAEKSFISYALFLTYFPHIVQGPIGRYNRFKNQIVPEGIAFDAVMVSQGAQLLLWGLFKKLVIADRLNIFVSDIYAHHGEYKGVILALATVLYSIQIYADFSGCIDIVSGVSEALGIKLDRNFNHPYFSKTIPEFWRRWHISLGEWFKDYIYYPVSVSRMVKKVKKNSKSQRFTELFSACLPIFVVWMITGIWHGASWNYVVWGLYYAAIMIASVVFEPTGEKLKKRLGINDGLFSWKLFQMTRTFIICCIGRVFFRADGLKAALIILKNMFTGIQMENIASDELFTHGLDYKNFFFALVSIAVLWSVDMLQERMHIRQELQKQGIVFKWIILFTGIFALIVFGIYGPGYDASSFIYEQF